MAQIRAMRIATISGITVTLSVAAAAYAEKSPHPVWQREGLISLAPSNTELLFDIGAGDKIAALCTNCAAVLKELRPQLVDKPTVGTFVSVNLERMTELKPRAVLLVSGQESLNSLLTRKKFQTYILPNSSLADISKNLRTIGTLCGREKEADSLAARLDKAITDLGAITRRSKSRRRVFFCVWPQPLLTIGKSSFLNHAVTICGGTNIASSLNTPYPHFTIEKLLLADPDVVILPHEARGQKMLKRFPWTALRASKTKRLYFLPPASEDALSRPTPRIIDGLYWLSQRIHPELEAELKNWRAQWKAPDTDQERGG